MRRRPVQAALPEAIGQGIDQRGQVGTPAREALQAFSLQRGHRLDQRRDQGHGFDAEARLDELDLGAQKLCEMGLLARRRGSADAHGLDMPVNAVEVAIQPTHAFAEAAQLLGDVADEITDDAGERLRCRDRLHEPPPRSWHPFRKDRLDRLGNVAERLVETTVERAAEPLGERSARGRDQLLDALEAELAQAVHDNHIKSERGDRQQRDRLAGIARVDRHRSPGGDVTRDGMRTAGGVGGGDLNRQAEPGDAPVEVLKEGPFAAEQAPAAGDVEPDPVRRVGGDQRRITRTGPQGDAPQPLEIRVRIAVNDLKRGRKAPRLGDGHARRDAERARGRIDRRDHAPAMIRNGRDHRLLDREPAAVRQRLGGLPAQPVGRPVRQEERYDPSHHSPPRSSSADCRRGRARARPASAAAQDLGCPDPRSARR